MYLLLFLAAGLIMSIAQMRVQSTYQKYKNVRANTNMTGAQVAQYILQANNIHDVQVVPGQGAELSDFYDPKRKIVSLSSNIYNTNSIAAVAVAAHEVGHAIQHATDSKFIALRNLVLPGAIISSKLSMFMILIGSMLFGSQLGNSLFFVGIVMYAVIGLFQLVTLPVEFDASSRALKNLEAYNLVDDSDIEDSKKMLNAAAFTYVAAFLGTVLTVLRFLMMFNDNRRR